MRSLVFAAAAFLVSFSAFCESPAISRNPRELGLVLVRELSVSGGSIAFRIDSNGCTSKASLKVKVRRDESMSGPVPHYRLSIERTAVDDCKAMLWEGVLIELDIVKDLGLSGSFTVSFENPILLAVGAKE